MSVAITMPRRLMRKPAPINWSMVMWPLANTTALGGVATGIMKARLAASTVGKTRTNGFSVGGLPADQLGV